MGVGGETAQQWPTLPSAGAWEHIACGSVSGDSMWHSQAGLTAEIGSWLLFDRYIIPAALDLFTKQHTESRKAFSRRRGLKPRGLCDGQAASVC